MFTLSSALDNLADLVALADLADLVSLGGSCYSKLFLFQLVR